MQHIAIKEVEINGNIVFCVPAISLKNKNQSVVQKIPHPMGNDILEYPTLEQAKDAVSRSGFVCVLPNGKKVLAQTPSKTAVNTTSTSYGDAVYSTIKSKINSNNSNVVASAILAIAEFPCEETFEILFEKLGEDNDLIRKNAISGICRYGKRLQLELVNHLKSNNWVERNSVITCIKNILEQDDIDVEKFIQPLIEVCQDQNPIVQSSALITLAQAYKTYQTTKK